MASESNEQPLAEDAGNEDEDQFADSVDDDGLSPNKVYKRYPAPTTTDVVDETSTVDVRMDILSPTRGDLYTKRSPAKKKGDDDEGGAQQSKVVEATQLSASQTPSETIKLPPGVSLPEPPQIPQRGWESAVDPLHGARLPPLSQAEQPPPRNADTKPANIPVIPISSIEIQVCKAARLVALELSHGGWPEAKPRACFKAAAAIEEFAKTVFLPNLLHGGQHHDNTEASNERVFLATMLALREVLTQNAYRIFQMEDMSRDEEQLADDAKPGSKRQKTLDYREERQYMAQLFGTGVIIASLQSLPESESLTSSFSAMMDSYDICNAEFASRMNRLDGRHQGVMLNGKKLKKEENVAWKVSYNRARELHPVVCRNNRRIEQRSDMTHHIVQIPKPNALFVSMVEEL
jgi:hypothetical protein